MFEIIETDRSPGLQLRYTSGRILTITQAWDITFAKWQAILLACQRGKLVADGGVKTCGLCALYYYGHSDECEYCPINDAGFQGCNSTPYQVYLQAVKNCDLETAEHCALMELSFLRRVYQ